MYITMHILDENDSADYNIGFYTDNDKITVNECRQWINTWIQAPDKITIMTIAVYASRDGFPSTFLRFHKEE